MGTGRLKKKDDLHYRKGSTAAHFNCECCKSFVENFEVRGLGGNVLAIEGRCRLMGMEYSRRYRVRPDHRCDAQELDRDKCWWMKGDR